MSDVRGSAAPRVISHGSITRGAHAFLRPPATVLAEARLELPSTGVVGLVGINGAGKSTLMLELAGVLARGRTRLRAPRAHPRARACEAAAFSPQRPTFPSWLSCVEITRMFGFAFDAIEAAYPALLLNELRSARGSTLSVGQTQTLSVALALHTHADMTLLDEPFAPLDFRRRVALAHILRARAAASDGIVIVSSQSAAELLDVCDWLVVLQAGRYAFSGAIADIVADACGEVARVRLEDHVMALL